MLPRLSVITAVQLPTDYNKKILTFDSIYDCFALLKTINTNTLNFHQYFKYKLSSYQPSHMHNIRHRTNSNFNTPLLKKMQSFKNSKMLFEPSNSYVEPPTKFA